MHCLHTQTQLLTDSVVLSSRGEILFYLLIVFITSLVVLTIVFYHLNLYWSSHCRKTSIYLGFYEKQKKENMNIFYF